MITTAELHRVAEKEDLRFDQAEKEKGASLLLTYVPNFDKYET